MFHDNKSLASPHISYIMPAYNCEATVIESLDSIVNENAIEGDEVIIVDDGSTDSTLKIITDYAQKHPIVRVIQHKRNKGGGAARNTAVENAQNSLIFCLDSDNILEKHSVPVLKAFLINTTADCAAFQNLCYFKKNKETITHKWVYPPRKITLGDCLSNHKLPPASGNYLYTKDSWFQAGGYPEYAHALDTWGFGFQQLVTGCKMVILENTGYFHRYGHLSYWMRESEKKTTSLIALQLLLPHIYLLEPTSIEHIMGKRHRTDWFENLEKTPLQLCTNSKASTHKSNNYMSRIRFKLQHEGILGVVSAIARKLRNAR